jgi:hypothetical protein
MRRLLGMKVTTVRWRDKSARPNHRLVRSRKRERPLQWQDAARSELKARNPCTTHPIGSMWNLTEKVKTEIPDYSSHRPEILPLPHPWI